MALVQPRAAGIPQHPPLATVHTSVAELVSKSPTRVSSYGFIDVGIDTSTIDLGAAPDAKIQQANGLASVPSHEIVPSAGAADIELVLDSPTKRYAPGEAITGYVAGWTQSAHIHIILEGRSKTYMRTDRGEYVNRAPLLYRLVHLKPEDHKVVPRISIAIPTKIQSGLEKLSELDASMKDYWSHEWPEQDGFEAHAGHPLPPSMDLPSQISYSPLLRLVSNADVVYKLTAIRSRHNPLTGRLVPEASSSTLITLATSRITKTTLRALQHDMLTLKSDLSIRTHLLTQDRGPSLGVYFRDAFSSATPTFYFMANVSSPKVCNAGGELPIAISVSILPPPPGKHYTFAVPDVHLSYFTCRIRSYTRVRVLCPLASASNERVKVQVFKDWVFEQRQDPKNVAFVPKDGDFRDQKCVVSVKVPADLTPGFKTFNIWRAYKIYLELGFAVKGREERVSMKGNFSVVAG